ncbi:hypothetical protein MMC34_008554 [Xylographa carneopallida]|nr:hypothetical protein [Xylographa carneopallida]
MFEAWSTASTRARCLNLASLLLTFLAFTSCCASFGAELFTAQNAHPISLDLARTYTFRFYHDRIESRLGEWRFADVYAYQDVWEDDEHDNRCTDGGRTLVAFAALAFFAALATLALAASRVASLPLRPLPLPERSLRAELCLSVVCAPLLLTSVALYASLCIQPFQNSTSFSAVRPTGFVYSIAGVFFAVAQMCVCWLVKHDEECWLGIPESSAYWAGKTRGDGDGYAEEKLSGFDEREGAASDALELSDDEDEEKEEASSRKEEEERRHKHGRSKSHRVKGKNRHGRPTRVYIDVPMKPIDSAYDYSKSYQTSEEL